MPTTIAEAVRGPGDRAPETDTIIVETTRLARSIHQSFKIFYFSLFWNVRSIHALAIAVSALLLSLLTLAVHGSLLKVLQHDVLSENGSFKPIIFFIYV